MDISKNIILKNYDENGPTCKVNRFADLFPKVHGMLVTYHRKKLFVGRAFVDVLNYFDLRKLLKQFSRRNPYGTYDQNESETISNSN